MKKSIYFISLLLIFGGCSSKGVGIKRVYSLYGNWHTKEQKVVDNNTKADVTIKEQFFKDGRLISSKWYNFKDSSGKNLGEYYITKEFKFNKNNNIIKAKFIRCSTGITQPLKSNNLGYKELSSVCKNQSKSNKITAKEYKIVGNKLYLGNRVYTKEALF
jgi:hypothetical protein